VRYEVSLPHPYTWHILEIQYPDDADRLLTFGYEDRCWYQDHAQA
jgi:hypothetical protein